jgi:hypothetical protein
MEYLRINDLKLSFWKNLRGYLGAVYDFSSIPPRFWAGFVFGFVFVFGRGLGFSCGLKRLGKA